MDHLKPLLSYRLIFVLRVDHPELRGPSYAPVPAGHRSVQTWQFENRADAVRTYSAILADSPDHFFGSEYIERVEVVSIDLRGFRGAKTVRRRLERDGRGQPWRDTNGKPAAKVAA